MIAAGVFAAVYAQRYDIGTLQRMGPGFFPVMLGTVLAILGVFITVPALFRPGTKIVVQWKTLAWVTAGIVVFGAILNLLGLVLTSAIMIILTSMPGMGMNWKSRIILAIAVSVITYLIFSYGLGMVIPVWPWSY